LESRLQAVARRKTQRLSTFCPPRRFAEFGILPGYEFPAEPASVRLLGDPNEERPISAARNVVAFFPQWNGDVFERCSVGPGWQLVLRRNEEVRWLNEGLEPTEAERQAGVILHDQARGFCLCGTCGRQLTTPRPDHAAGTRRRARAGNARDPFGHVPTCARSGQPPQAAGIVTRIAAEVLRLVAMIVLAESQEPRFDSA